MARGRSTLFKGGERGFTTFKASREAQTLVAGEGGACSLPEVGGAVFDVFSRALNEHPKPLPMSSELGTYKTVRARLWSWLGPFFQV